MSKGTLVKNFIKGSGGSGGGGATGKIKILNVVETGSLTRNGAVYSGFSSSNYLEFSRVIDNGLINTNAGAYDVVSVLAQADSWKIRVKFKTGAVVTTQTILGQKNNNYTTPQISIYGGKINICISFTGNSWDFDEVFDSMNLSENTEYYVDLEFAGSSYVATLYDATMTVISTETVGTSSSKIYNAGQFKIGADSNGDGFEGEMDIEGWEIEVDSQVWWKGVEEVVASGDIDLPAYLKKPTIVTDADNTNLSLAGNTIYKFGVIDELVLSSAEVSDSETIIYFTTDSTITFTDNSGVRWGGGNEQPQLEPNTVYCIAIRNGLAEIDNFGTTA